ncbi:MAG: hypothetical protein AB203_02345 [Parcubacteria bacterium C7867-008]|nr:MAG: hypothetical protein AB203_02345 [Parcubacteria bacterium C7867-008]
MAKPEEKQRSFALRREGKSIKEIAEILHVSKSAASLWVRDIEMTPEQKESLRQRQIEGGHIGRIRGSEANHRMRIERMDLAKELAVIEVPTLSCEQLFFIGLGLYWGEGTKTESSRNVSIANSDPRVIQLMIRWFIECLDVDKERLQPKVFISDVHKDREEKITEYWEETLDIPRQFFSKTIFLPKGKKIYENHDMYYGVLALRVRRGGDIRNRILATICRIAELSATMPV